VCTGDRGAEVCVDKGGGRNSEGRKNGVDFGVGNAECRKKVPMTKMQ
jgi:hypothetical protein